MQRNFKCCKSKDFSNFVCIVCNAIFHPSCMEQRLPELVKLGGYKIFCSSDCQMKQRNTEEQKKNLTEEISTLQKEIEEKNRYILRLKRNSKVFEEDVSDVEKKLTIQLEELTSQNNRLIKEIELLKNQNANLKSECELWKNEKLELEIKVETLEKRNSMSSNKNDDSNILVSLDNKTDNRLELEIESLKKEILDIRDTTKEAIKLLENKMNAIASSSGRNINAPSIIKPPEQKTNSHSYAVITNTEKPPIANEKRVNSLVKVGKNLKKGSQKQTFSSSTVKSAFLEAQNDQIIPLIEETKSVVDGNKSDDERWEVQRPRNKRKFLVGSNSQTNISTVPRYVQLHVTRLNPNINLEDLRASLVGKFPDIQLEDHASMRPDIYKSCKVTLQRQQLKDAWNRDVWPEGAIVSHFFQKIRTVPQI